MRYPELATMGETLGESPSLNLAPSQVAATDRTKHATPTEHRRHMSRRRWTGRHDVRVQRGPVRRPALLDGVPANLTALLTVTGAGSDTYEEEEEVGHALKKRRQKPMTTLEDPKVTQIKQRWKNGRHILHAIYTGLACLFYYCNHHSIELISQYRPHACNAMVDETS